MTSTRERQQRAAARARLAREMAERQAAAKKRRQRSIIIGSAVAVVLVLVGTVWAVAALTGDEPETPPAAQPTPGPTAGPTTDPVQAGEPGPCAWNEAPPGGTVVDVGVPPEGEPRDGTGLLTVATTLGDITVEMDLAKVPCIAASFSHLASQDFYDDLKCHRAFDGVLQCGDPTVTASDEFTAEDGRGGPAYQYADENLPVGQEPPYPRGTMAMANSGPGTNGSQFFFVSQDIALDGPNYAVVGTVVEGLDVLDAIEAEGYYTDEFGVTRPNAEVIITDVSVETAAE